MIIVVFWCPFGGRRREIDPTSPPITGWSSETVGGSIAEAADSRGAAPGSRRDGLRRGDAPDRPVGGRGDPAAAPDAQRRGALSRDQEPGGAAGGRGQPIP